MLVLPRKVAQAVCQWENIHIKGLVTDFKGNKVIFLIHCKPLLLSYKSKSYIFLTLKTSLNLLKVLIIILSWCSSVCGRGKMSYSSSTILDNQMWKSFGDWMLFFMVLMYCNVDVGYAWTELFVSFIFLYVEHILFHPDFVS